MQERRAIGAAKSGGSLCRIHGSAVPDTIGQGHASGESAQSGRVSRFRALRADPRDFNFSAKKLEARRSQFHLRSVGSAQRRNVVVRSATADSGGKRIELTPLGIPRIHPSGVAPMMASGSHVAPRAPRRFAMRELLIENQLRMRTRL